jgi:hemoglobin
MVRASSVFIGLLAAVVATAAQAQTPNEAALAAFGGYEGLGKITHDFVERVQRNPRISAFFKDADIERLGAMLTDQFCDVLGGGCKYAGKSMKESHQSMNVASADFNALTEDLQNALTAAKVPSHQQNKLIAKLAPMHRDVVTR